MAYAEAGFAVVPCIPGTKRPHPALVPRGVRDASRDFEVVRSWWRRIPRANVGVALGHGVVVLDVDDSGTAARILALAEARGWPAVRTPSGGLHVYLRTDRPTRTTVLKASGRHFGELRGDGAYVLAPPSQVEGARYEWAVTGEPPVVADPVAWAGEVLRQVGVELDPDPGAAAEPIPERVPEGMRNVTLTSLAGSLRRRGFAQGVIEAALAAVNERVCDPPLPEEEVRRIAASVSRYAPGQADPGGENSIPASIEVERAGIKSWEPAPLGEVVGPDRVEWVWEGLLARGLVTDLYGLWKVGKTTLLGCILRELTRGGELLGHPVAPCRALVVSEESAAKWARRCRELGIPPGSHDLIARPFKRRPSSDQWDQFLDYLARLVRERGYGLVIFDALPHLWPVVRENDAAEVLQAVRPVVGLLEAGAAVLFVRHPRKSDGEEATAGRGSGALSAFADVIVEIRRYRPEDRDDRRRVFTVYSREEPFELVGGFTGTTYTALGRPGEVRQEDRLATLLDLLPTEPPGLTVQEVLATWPGDLRPSERTILGYLQHLLARGWVARSGKGARGDPFRWWRDSILASPFPIVAGNEKPKADGEVAPDNLAPGDQAGFAPTDQTYGLKTAGPGGYTAEADVLRL